MTGEFVRSQKTIAVFVEDSKISSRPLSGADFSIPIAVMKFNRLVGIATLRLPGICRSQKES